MQRPGLVGFLLLAIAVTLLIVVPMDSAWKWPTVMLLFIISFIMLFLSAAQRPNSRRMRGGHTDTRGDIAYFGSGVHVASGKHKSHGDCGPAAHDGVDGGGGGGDGGGGGGGD